MLPEETTEDAEIGLIVGVTVGIVVVLVIAVVIAVIAVKKRRSSK